MVVGVAASWVSCRSLRWKKDKGIELTISGVVSQSALEAGGHVHGIVPSALTVRAAGSGSAEKKAAESAAASSAEGAGKDLLDDMQKYEGRLQLEIVGSMHEVCGLLLITGAG